MNKFVAGTNDVKKRNFSVHIEKVFRIWTQAKAWIKLYKDLPTKVLWLHLWKECIKNWTINWWWNFNWHISLRFMENLLTLSWRRSLSYRNQFIDLQWFLYDLNFVTKDLNFILTLPILKGTSTMWTYVTVTYQTLPVAKC